MQMQIAKIKGGSEKGKWENWRQRKAESEREREKKKREVCLRISDLFVWCLHLVVHVCVGVLGVIGAKLISTYSRNANYNQFNTLCHPAGLLRVRNGKQDSACGEFCSTGANVMRL